jgi:hypothetical protein
MAATESKTVALPKGATAVGTGVGVVTFAINGEKKVLDASRVDSSLTINDYIRLFTPFKGTKLSCGNI